MDLKNINKKYLIIGGAIVLIAGLVGIYFYRKNKTKPKFTDKNVLTQAEADGIAKQILQIERGGVTGKPTSEQIARAYALKLTLTDANYKYDNGRAIANNVVTHKDSLPLDFVKLNLAQAQAMGKKICSIRDMMAVSKGDHTANEKQIVSFKSQINQSGFIFDDKTCKVIPRTV